MEPSRVSKLIEDLGDAAEVAAKIGKSPEAVRQWKFRSIIPRSAWPDLIEKFPGVTLKKLRELERAA